VPVSIAQPGLAAVSLLGLIMAGSKLVLASENPELWDFYPSNIGFAQFDSVDEVIAADIRTWAGYDSADVALLGQNFSIEVDDAMAEASWLPIVGDEVVLTADEDWVWEVQFESSFNVGACILTYDQSLGVRFLDGDEGYLLAQREQLFWTGPPDACPGRVHSYFQSTIQEPVMVAHLNDWHRIGGPIVPTDSGRFEMRLWHDLRRTRRLLPFDATADAGADPFIGLLGGVADGALRYDRIEERFQQLVFIDGFESQ
jgi:hypothetical protein